MATTENDLPRQEAPAAFGELMAQVPAGPVAPETDEQRVARAAELEQMSRDYLAAARRRDATERWKANVPDNCIESDWEWPALQPFRPMIDRVLAYQYGSKGILASGPTGRGKSRAVWELTRRMCEDGGIDVRFYHAMEWFTKLQRQISYGRDEAEGWVQSVAGRQMVFIDDYGQEALQASRQDWAQSWFFRFLDIRGGKQLPLLITTNLRAEEMAERSGRVRGDPLIRRLLAVAEPVVFETAEERASRGPAA